MCYGWVDSIRKSIDDISYSNRFTPRKPGSSWSAGNIKRAQALIEQGRMQPAGLIAYETRKENTVQAQRLPEERLKKKDLREPGDG